MTLHLCQRVVLVCVEAGRHQDQVGREAGDRRLDRVAEHACVLLVSGPGRKGDVQRRRPLVERTAAARVERPLVQRDEEDALVVLQDRLRAVAVVHVPVDDRHSPRVAVVQQPPRGHGDVAEEAEAHCPLAERVVARRPHEREPSRPRRLDREPRRDQRGPVRRLGRDRVAVQPRRPVHRGDLRHIRRVVAQLDVVDGRSLTTPPLAEVVEQCRVARGRVGVVPGRMQVGEDRVDEEIH